MSGYHHNFPRGYTGDERDASAEDLFQHDAVQQYPEHFVYPEFWPATTGDYNISVEGPGSGLYPVQTSYPTTSHPEWPQLPGGERRGSASSQASIEHPVAPISNYMLPDYSTAEPAPFAYGPPYPIYSHGQHSPAHSDVLLSPSGYGSGSQHVSPHTTPPLHNHLTPPTTPGGSGGFTASPSPDLHSPLLPSLPYIQPKQEERSQPLYTHRDQLQFFKDALSLPAAGVSGPFVPQLMYKPHTNSDRRRYVEEVDMEAPIHFWVENPSECGIPLSDALHSRVRRLLKRDETVFEGRGPSVSIRLEWPGYRQWSRQIPTKDFRSPPGPITRAKLAKNVAKCVQRFIQERHGQPMEDDADARWRVGPGPNQIKLEDLVLVSIHHVSMGSWQPHLRLRRPL